MKVDDEIHLALSVLYIFAKGKPYIIRLLIASVMDQLLMINRVMKDETCKE